jgi:hypothetical protein
MIVPTVIGLHSPAPQSGKSTVAAMLEARGYVVVPFAAALKAVARTMLQQLGLPADAIDEAMQGDKSTRVYHDVTCRRLLQTLGTEWGRNCLGQQVWVDCWRLQASRTLCRAHMVVADDVRFPNEADAIHDLGGEVWQIVRPGAPGAGSHASETGLPVDYLDKHILNNGTISDLAADVGLLV